MYIGVCWCVLLLVSSGTAGRWRWPEGQASASVRIDTKVRFIDGYDTDETTSDKETRQTQRDEPFKEPSETEGFYNQPPGAGRYPVRVEEYREPYIVDGHAIYRVVNNQQKNVNSDGTLDSLQYCKCTSNPDCNLSAETKAACGPGKYLCCYKRPNEVNTHKTEFFNEVEDERPMLLPGRENLARPFPPPPGYVANGLFSSYGPGHDPSHAGVFDKPIGILDGYAGGVVESQRKPNILVGPEGPTGNIGPHRTQTQPNVLVGPEGPTGNIGPHRTQTRPNVLVGPEGPTGNIGPHRTQTQPNVLVGPEGPTGNIGPHRAQTRPNVLVGPEGPTGNIGPQQTPTQPNVLVGPEGPTGNIGPVSNHDAPYSESAQRGVLVGPVGPAGIVGSYGRRPVLVGPGGPTGIIGPGRGSRGPGVLVGPGGPTGIIGPRYDRHIPGLLTGPGGPTGSIGPGRQILVGPGGPTGQIGPQGYFGK